MIQLAHHCVNKFLLPQVSEAQLSQPWPNGHSNNFQENFFLTRLQPWNLSQI
jgi:hypothetical protein